MNKAYSTKALPPGTVLREWRLEEVLGVGGFGIVYKGRGIYFNELVAIKEYFPSSISERDAEATVVPIDSDAEEVHALGLKKFVEEAKLLWNLSTPSRHPNIVSVRSLFEIHGTAYMVMDFEDGMSLSRLLKQGQRWNERSLIALIKPIAEGLERAHRVGVLHRDIKPPNILINDSGRPVLIDFGSARFETGEATSTKVTFHTPPYAAIEQYVKTFPQGPWTDIYALGVVLYECITGTKPPEVLERMHGGAGDKLASGSWPGYSRRFLAAVDAAMGVRPDERPQSISDWLAMFDAAEDTEAEEDDGEVTRVVPFDTTSESIVPVAPVAEGFQPVTSVPDHPEHAEFKRAGHTHATKKGGGAAKAEEPVEVKAAPVAPVAAAGAAAAESAAAAKTAAPIEPKPSPVDDKSAADRIAANKAAATRKSDNDAEPKKGVSRPVLIGGAAAALVAVVGGGWALTRGSSGSAIANDTIQVLPTSAEPVVVPVAEVAEGAQALDAEAKAAAVPEALLAPVTSFAAGLSTSPPSDAEAGERARAVYGSFADALFKSVEERTGQIAGKSSWINADPATLPQERQLAVAELRKNVDALRSASAQARAATDPRLALAGARQSLASWKAFSGAALAIANLDGGDQQRLAQAEQLAREKRKLDAANAAKATIGATATARTMQPTAVAAAPAASTASADTLSPSTTATFNGIISDGRDMARQVIRMGERAKPGSTPEDRAAYDMLKQNAALARTYDNSLATLKDSFRGVRSDKQADGLIKQAKQTRAYLVFLVKRSSGASR